MLTASKIISRFAFYSVACTTNIKTIHCVISEDLNILFISMCNFCGVACFLKCHFWFHDTEENMITIMIKIHSLSPVPWSIVHQCCAHHVFFLLWLLIKFLCHWIYHVYEKRCFLCHSWIKWYMIHWYDKIYYLEHPKKIPRDLGLISRYKYNI